MNFIFEQIRTGGDRNFGYLIGDREAKVCALIDPSFSPQVLMERADIQGLQVSHVINTHGHDDHTNGNEEVKDRTDALLVAFEESKFVTPDVGVKDGDSLNIGQYTLRFLYTPGHCKDHMVIGIAEQAILLTGDLIFVGKVGGTKSRHEAEVEFDSIKQVLRKYPTATTLWPGHDYGCRPVTTIEFERHTNPFLLCNDKKEFFELKETWPSFKWKYGLK